MGYPPAAARMQPFPYSNGFHGGGGGAGYPHYNMAAAAATGLAMAMQRAQQMMMYNGGALNKDESRRAGGSRKIEAIHNVFDQLS